ncbi:MAG: alanine racemase, partial [Solirubrobacteraceae bacterium]
MNLAAIERNVVRLRSRLTGDAELCAVVKAQASGHGAVPVAGAALAGGAS